MEHSRPDSNTGRTLKHRIPQTYHIQLDSISYTLTCRIRSSRTNSQVHAALLFLFLLAELPFFSLPVNVLLRGKQRDTEATAHHPNH